MGDYEIRKGVPMPERRRQHKYRWHEMEVGDSFLFNGETSAQAASAASQASKRYGKRFVTRKTDEGIVCWRTA